MINDKKTLEAAIQGYYALKAEIESRMDSVRKQLADQAYKPGESKHHNISAAGRRRISDAQKKRWAAAKAER